MCAGQWGLLLNNVSTMTATLLARDLTLSFGDQLVLDAVDVGLAARARVGIVGPNGTGKT
ncbi:MAG: hypothetical protein QOG30_1397, partial [Acidimicrobiaceae bacterium]